MSNPIPEDKQETLLLEINQTISIQIQAFPKEALAVIVTYDKGNMEGEDFVGIKRKQIGVNGEELQEIMSRYPELHDILKSISYEIIDTYGD